MSSSWSGLIEDALVVNTATRPTHVGQASAVWLRSIVGPAESGQHTTLPSLILAGGLLFELVPDTALDVSLYWQHAGGVAVDRRLEPRGGGCRGPRAAAAVTGLRLEARAWRRGQSASKPAVHACTLRRPYAGRPPKTSYPALRLWTAW